MKYIVISGGVISGIGKGVLTSSTAVLLKSCGLRVTSIKIDPYLNIDAGTFSPYEHGEVFVLNDGGEVDLDLGNYERFLDITLHKENNITTGKIYQAVIEKERKGEYLGKTVQVVPHVTNEIQEWIERVASIPVDGKEGSPDICVIELGGTVGDIESYPFVEALRQFQFRVGRENFCQLHVSLVPFAGEQKTKPTQHSVRELRGLGISPDIIVCRSTLPLDSTVKQKIANFCHVDIPQVLSVQDVSNIYRVPILLKNQKLIEYLKHRLNFNELKSDNIYMNKWLSLADKFDRCNEEVIIAVVGKYTSFSDAYSSLKKALRHAAIAAGKCLKIQWVEATDLEDEHKLKNAQEFHDAWQRLCSASGILVPGGFGERGLDGKLAACKWARTMKIPFFGICFGFQAAIIEYARNVMNMPDANSIEVDKNTKNPIVIEMPEISKTHLGGTMRLGLRDTIFQTKNSLARKLYGNVEKVSERHRHRFEVNPDYIQKIEEAGLKFVGKDDTNKRMEIVEIEDHPFFIGVQYHPEYLTRPLNPHPLFQGFVRASCGMDFCSIVN